MAPLGLLAMVFVAMASRDVLGVTQTVAEAKGRENLAAVCDVAGDIALLLSLGTAANAASTHGLWSPYTASVVVVESVASFLSTKYATRLSRRMDEEAAS